MEVYLPYVIGAAVVLLLNRLGIQLPLQPIPPPPVPQPPAPAPVPQPGADKELTAALAWCQQASVGAIRIDPEDRVALAALKAAVGPLVELTTTTTTPTTTR